MSGAWIIPKPSPTTHTAVRGKTVFQEIGSWNQKGQGLLISMIKRAHVASFPLTRHSWPRGAAFTPAVIHQSQCPLHKTHNKNGCTWSHRHNSAAAGTWSGVDFNKCIEKPNWNFLASPVVSGRFIRNKISKSPRISNPYTQGFSHFCDIHLTLECSIFRVAFRAAIYSIYPLKMRLPWWLRW